MAADPNWSSVRLLATFNAREGTDFEFVDIKGERTFAQISTSQIAYAFASSPFGTTIGGTSVFLSGSGAGLTLPASADWNLGTSDFTIEGWYQSGSSSALAGAVFAGNWVASTGARGWEFFRQANTRQIGFRWSTTGTDEPAALIGSAGAAWGSSWVHVCAMRSAGTLYLFVGGVLVGSAACPAIFNNTRPLGIGRRLALTSATYNVGYLDEWRISAVARYATTGFTVPTSPFDGDGTNPARVTQGVALVMPDGDGGANVTQGVQLVLSAPVVPARISQGVALVAEPGIRPARIGQAVSLILMQSQPCITTRAQIWTITRRDGVVLTFTSHDRPIVRFGRTYTPCRSLNPSASENASSLGAVGNMELTGIIDDESISEEDLYGGKFDDAFVEVDLIDWTEPTGAAMRIASGWTGEMTQGAVSFNMEVLGGSARLNQQALVQMIAPSCRWVFGDPATCKKDREALKMTGAVLSAQTRGAFTATISGDGAGRQWENGTVRWTSGRNTGQSCEIKSLDIPGGGVVLWSAASYGPEAGDTFDLLPGCDLAKTGGCTLYANVINFGGFSDVPGQDSLLETPEAKY